MALSGALTLTDLNDFITPSQACIKPVEQVKPEGGQEDVAAASTEIRIDVNGSYYEVATGSSTSTGDGRRLEQAQVSLNDCLACSGCITSAESVLITLQSHTEVLNFLESNASAPTSSRKIPVISIAPQSLASLAASLSFYSSFPVTPRQLLRRLRVFCKEVLGFDFVFDTTFARHVALREHVKEFIERKEKHRQRKSDPASDPPQLPMLAGACPGWICYAEKTHAEMLPFISNTKSPQQVMGTLVKVWMGSRWGKMPQDVYHVTVMPCYDKKLEASRSDFYNELYATRDVDCVITTGELERLAKDKGYDLTVPVPGELDSPPAPLPLSTSPTITDYTLPELLQHPGTASGSYLHSIISHLQETNSELELFVKQVRNADYEEFVLRRRGGESEGEVIFKGAKCYGFRNLQNVVRKVGKESGVRVGSGAAGRLSGKAVGIRRGRKAPDDGSGEDKGYDYIEVMACPGGCVNGGGQLKPPSREGLDEEGFLRDWGDNGVIAQSERSMEVKWGNREWNKKVEEAYWHDLPTPPATPPLTNGDEKMAGEIRDVGHVYGSCKQMKIADRLLIDVTDELGRRNSNASLRTQYRAVESEVIGLAVKW
ncbi:nuclear prelamin a recognition factor-like [Moniliophthora roreri MCA 2997]|uniref:Cytosolic Fe-S cluster assembly factor NAR1 n=1 Tax=Moniliophthora roreri (strain MCA 2997) TaxID=1381753 RepID=V2XTT9_MONRO|nr:nuclear prelamin a recognition factor-like [Moniliophthora roreri MCA 2997]